MLVTKYSYISNVSSNATQFNSSSSTVPNTLFELMKSNVLIVDKPIAIENEVKTKENNEQK